MSDTTQLMQSALALHRAGHTDQAEQLYRRVLGPRPNDPHALHLLGVIAFRKGQHEQAAGWVRRAIQVSPQVAQFHHTLGVILDCMSRPHEAVEAFRQAIAHGKTTPQTRLGLGFALFDLARSQVVAGRPVPAGSLEQAEEQARMVLQGAPDDPGARELLGKIEDLRRIARG